jgi:formate dehydrogenase subunit gamma
MDHVTWDEATASGIVNELKRLEGATLPILHALQEMFGYVDKRAVPLIADALNVSKAEIFGAITFYHDFREAPAGRRVVKICRAEACQSMGCEDLVAHMEKEHGVVVDTTSKDGQLTVETVYCLGNCALGPAALIDNVLVGRVDTELLDAICKNRPHDRMQG